MSNKKISDGEYYGKAVTWTIAGIGATIGIVLLVFFSTGSIR